MIRIRRTEDLQAIHELDRLTFPGDKPTLDREKTHTWWVAEQDDDPVGFIGFGADRGTITRYGVLPGAAGTGLGKRLVRTVKRYARRQGFTNVRTYVLVSNIASLRALIGCGFKPYKVSMFGDRQFIDLEARLTTSSSARI